MLQEAVGQQIIQEMVSQPILQEHSILWVAAGTAVITFAAGICFTIIVSRNPEKAIYVFRGGRALQHITVLTVVFATLLLGLERILTGEAVASLLGGIIGYVLGSLPHFSDAPPSRNNAPNDDSHQTEQHGEKQKK